MDFRKVECFKIVAEMQSITKAAEILHVSQPALSRTIHQVEKEIGTRLFDRVGRTIVLNENGKIFLHYTDKAIRALDAARTEIDANLHLDRSKLVILPRIPMGRPGFLASLYKVSQSEAHLKFIYASENVPRDDFDIEIYGTFGSAPLPNATLITTEEVCAVIPKSHPLANNDAVDLAELKSETFIVSAPSELSTIVQDMCHEANFSPKIGSELQIYTDVLGFVEEGLGITIAPRKSWLLGWEDRFALLQIKDIKRTRSIYIRTANDRVRSPQIEEFESFLTAFFGG